ncbi:MAG: glycosyltransferase family 4 protein [Terracidiphilus sp.]
MSRKRILVLTPRFPHPAIGGDRLRILHICRALATRFDLTLLSLCETREEMQLEPDDGLFGSIERVHLPRWRSYWNTALALPGARPLQLAYYDSPAFRRKLAELHPRHDLTLAHLIRTGQYVERLGGRRILEMTDAISMNYARMRELRGGGGWKKWVYTLEQKRLKRYELETVDRFDRIWLTSRADRLFLDPQQRRPIDVIPNGADLSVLPWRAPAADARVIVFIANMVSLQNQDACQFFIEQILPQVRSHADVVFRIVGNAPEAVAQRFRGIDGVQLTGRVERIEEGVGGAFCGVCPVRAGAGIQNKVLEYLALGLPCVSSRVGLGGVEAEPGAEVLAYDTPEEAAAQILELHRDAGLRLRLAQAGRALVERRYDWQSVYRAFVDSCLATGIERD